MKAEIEFIEHATGKYKIIRRGDEHIAEQTIIPLSGQTREQVDTLADEMNNNVRMALYSLTEK